jgi:hypothetical protein
VVATVYLHSGTVGVRGMMCVFMTSSVILLNNSTSPDATCFIRISLAQLASKKKVGRHYVESSGFLSVSTVIVRR